MAREVFLKSGNGGVHSHNLALRINQIGGESFVESIVGGKIFCLGLRDMKLG